jgi:phage shock protein A
MTTEVNAMALISRLTQLFQADFHAVLDRIEEPGALLRQAVRDMEDALAQDEQRLKYLHAECAQMTNRLGELQSSFARLDEELDVCFAADNDDLAKGVIKRQLETRKLGDIVARKKAVFEEEIAHLEARTAENRERLEGMRQKADVLAENEPVGGPYDPARNVSVHAEEVDVAFLREKQKRRAS